MYIISTKRNKHFDTKHVLNKSIERNSPRYCPLDTYQNLLYKLVYLLLKFDTVKHENNKKRKYCITEPQGKLDRT